jgi:hypothetical protein
VIHTASPIPRDNLEKALSEGVEGTLNLLRAATAAGAKNFVLTGTNQSFPAGGPFGPDGMLQLNEVLTFFDAANRLEHFHQGRGSCAWGPLARDIHRNEEACRAIKHRVCGKAPRD